MKDSFPGRDAHSLLLPRLTSADSDRAAAAAQLGQLQAALESEAASRGEAGRWRIVACKEFSELAAVVDPEDEPWLNPPPFPEDHTIELDSEDSAFEDPETVPE